MNKLIIVAGVFAMVWVCNAHPASKPHYYDTQALTAFAAAETDPQHYVYPYPRQDTVKGGVYVGR